jgi:hypothetical protein
VTLQSPASAIDRIALTQPVKALLVVARPECGQPTSLDLERVTRTIPKSIMQVLFADGQCNALDKRNPAVQIQYAQDSETVKKVSKASKIVDEMRAVYLKLFRNPADLQLNILYAEIAEKRGKRDAAIATYERLALLDPDNNKWKRNIKRLRDLAQPPETAVNAVLGARVDTNGPLNADSVGDRVGYNASVVLTLDHKRSMGGLKYQATGQLYIDYNVTAAASDLYLAALQFGPLLSASESWQVRPALLLERLLLDRDNHDSLSYSAGTLINFKNIGDGPIKTVDISLYYVNFYDETPGKDAIVLTSSSGFEVRGFREGDSLGLTPTITFNGARSGLGSDGFRDQYYEVGLDLTYAVEVLENFEIGPVISFRYRDYTDYEPGGNTTRLDRNYIFGLEATAIDLIPNIFVLGTYSWERNKSTLADQTYRNHSINVNFIKSF